MSASQALFNDRSADAVSAALDPATAILPEASGRRAWYDRRLWSVRLGDALVLMGAYWTAATLYSLTLFLNRLGPQDPEDRFFDVASYMQTGGLQYLTHFLLTLPVWFLLFRVLHRQALWLRLLLHLVLLPLWVVGGRLTYYALSDVFGLYHMSGPGSIWDLYIPALFYVLQFGLMHGYEYWNRVQEKTRNEHALRVAALRSELSAIKAQINPHFLYNVFNTINASIPPELEETLRGTPANPRGRGRGTVGPSRSAHAPSAPGGECGQTRDCRTGGRR